MDDFECWKLTLKIRFWHFLKAIFCHWISLMKKSNPFLWSVQSYLQSEMFLSNSIDMMKNLLMWFYFINRPPRANISVLSVGGKVEWFCLIWGICAIFAKIMADSSHLILLLILALRDSTASGLDRQVSSSPWPNWPRRPSPQVNTSNSEVRATIWLVLTAT